MCFTDIRLLDFDATSQCFEALKDFGSSAEHLHLNRIRGTSDSLTMPSVPASAQQLLSKHGGAADKKALPSA